MNQVKTRKDPGKNRPEAARSEPPCGPKLPPERAFFVVPGPPVPKARARKGKGGHWYTPQKTIDYEQNVATWALGSPTIRRWVQTGGTTAPLSITLAIFFQDSRARDGDNLLKSIQDSLNKRAWKDDSQFVKTMVTKGIDRERPRVEVTIEVVP